MVKRYAKSSIPTVHHTEDIPVHEARPGFSFRLFRGLDTIIGFAHAEPDAETSFHEHPWEQIVHVTRGETDFYIDGEEVTMAAGDVVFIPPSVEHELRPNAAQSVDFIVIWPLREDFLPETAYQEEFAVEEP